MPKTYERREFLTDLLKVPCATLLLGVTGPIKVLAEEGDDDYRPLEHNYAMGVQIEKCIGCGKCVEACKIENDVPIEPYYFRTWVERYKRRTDRALLLPDLGGALHHLYRRRGERR